MPFLSYNDAASPAKHAQIVEESMARFECPFCQAIQKTLPEYADPAILCPECRKGND